jgi:hypothetical protein
VRLRFEQAITAEHLPDADHVGTRIRTRRNRYL